MALPSRYGIDKKMNSMEGLSAYENGGKGSGNFGHSGRPGEIGGSGKGGGSGESFRGYEDLSKPMPKTAAEDEKLLTGKKYEFGIEGFHRDVMSGRKKDLDKAGMRAFWRADVLYQMSQGFLSKRLAVSIARDRMKELAKDPDDTKYSVKWDDKNAEYKIKKNGVELNGGKGSGNFGHAGRPGEVGGSSSGGLSGISKAIATQKKFQDQAKIVQEDIEDRIGQKVKKGEEYTALDEASSSRFKYFHGEDGTEYTYDKGNGMITKTNPKTGDQEVVTKKKKDYDSERSGVNVRDGHRIASEFADLSAELVTARTHLKMLKEDKGKAYKDLAGRSRFVDRSSEISRSLHYAEALRKSKLSKETKRLVKEMESELKSIRDEYDKLGTEKYFDPDLNHEN